MKTILAFAGSNSKTSINKQLATYASTLLDDNVTVNVLDLNDFEMPIYGIDYETEKGIPQAAQTFINHIKSADGIILSFAEHNGAYSVAFKNVFDWISRVEKKCWLEKPMLLMATSPGGRGGATVLEAASKSFPHMGGNVVSTFSLPSFGSNFSDGKIMNQELNDALLNEVKALQDSL